jgi:NAD(P)-dependent dehydrogenase (short-subunit alcohol dehydrogenase family)
MRLQNRTALVTGAGGGMGAACAAALAHEGANMALIDLSEDAARKVKAAAVTAGARATAFGADICDEVAVGAAVHETVREFGRIDILVNLAGSQGPGAPFWEVSADAWRKCMDVNLYGTFLMCGTVAAHMVKAGYGRIINVASGAGVHPMPFFSAYSASKAGVIHFSRTIAEELKPYGITVNALGVHGITPMWRDVLEAENGGGTAANLRAMVDGGFNPRPEENIPALMFLASEESGHITGQYFEANSLPGCITGKR